MSLVAYSSDDDSPPDDDDENRTNSTSAGENLKNLSISSEKNTATDSVKSSSVDVTSKDKLVTNIMSKIPTESSQRIVLPLPAELQSMYQDEADLMYKDNTEAHCGKIRSFAHERGVWATYVYIHYLPDSAFYDVIQSIISKAENHGINLCPVGDFHISLSKTLKLRYHWIPDFIKGIKTQLVNFCRFKVMLQSTEVYTNEEKTRTFLGLKVHLGADRLHKLVQKVDKCLEEFKLPCFYENPSFHLSCAFCVGDVADKIEEFMAEVNEAFQLFVNEHPDCRTIWVQDVQIKSGNKLFSIPLKS